MLRPSLPALLAFLALAGCDALSGADYKTVRQLGTPAADGQAIAAPDTVVAGEPFEVTVTTQGGGCHERADGVEVGDHRGGLELRPYDIVSVPVGERAGCTYIRKHLSRTTVVMLNDPGLQRLRVIGSEGFGPRPEEVAVDRMVVVQ